MWFPENPVSARELYGRMRDQRTFLVVTGYLALVSAAIIIVYYSQTRYFYYYGQYYSMRAELGKTIYQAMVYIELALIHFIAPGLTANTLTLEREKKTLDLLKTTLLTPRDVVLGKFWPALVYILMLIFTSVPIHAVASVLGGVSLTEIGISTLILVATGVFLCSLGLFISSGSRKTTTATVTSYLVTLLPIIPLSVAFFLYDTGLPGIYALPGVAANTSNDIFFLYGNWIVGSANPFITVLLSNYFKNANLGLFLVQVPPLSWSPNSYANNVGYTMLSPWIIFVIAYVIMSFFILMAATRLTAKTEK